MMTAADRHVRDFIAQDLANTAWAFAKIDRSDSLIFAALAKAAEHCMDDFNSQNLANTAWACATLQQSEEKLFVGLARAT